MRKINVSLSQFKLIPTMYNVQETAVGNTGKFKAIKTNGRFENIINYILAQTKRYFKVEEYHFDFVALTKELKILSPVINGKRYRILLKLK